MRLDNFYYKSKYTIPFPLHITEPFIPEHTHNEHYTGHFTNCQEKLISILEQKQILQNSNIKEIIISTYGKFNHMKEWQCASQIYAHILMWESMTKPNTTKPNEHTKRFINKNYGGTENMRSSMIQKCSEHIGSGWIFLVLNRNNELHIITTINTFTPINIHDTVEILLAIDIWEHAFYRKYGPNVVDYVKDIYDNIINWDRVNELLAQHNP